VFISWDRAICWISTSGQIVPYFQWISRRLYSFQDLFSDVSRAILITVYWGRSPRGVLLPQLPHTIRAFGVLNTYAWAIFGDSSTWQARYTFFRQVQVTYISKVSSVCYFHLRRLKSIRRILSEKIATSSASVISRLDYYNSILSGPPKSSSMPLPWVQNAAAGPIRAPHDHVVAWPKPVALGAAHHLQTIPCSLMRRNIYEILSTVEINCFWLPTPICKQPMLWDASDSPKDRRTVLLVRR